MQQPLSRAITDYQNGNLSLDQLRRQVEDEIKTPDGLRAIRSLLETSHPSLPRSVRDLLVRFSTAPSAATSLRPSALSGSSASRPAGEHDAALTQLRSSSSAAIGPGTVLGGRYRLVREIGRGGMGVVYLADGLVDLQQFAVKVLNCEFLQHPDAIRVLREEARKSLAMRHANIVGVYPLEREGEQYYLPMEYLEGKTVRDLLDQDFARGMPLDQAWPIVKGAGAALAFAHDHGVIHSDLKPSNIFVTTGGRPRVLDFGIARALRDRRHFDTDSLGAMTAAYASCEMIDRKPPDFRDDVYGFACVVYELLSGKHPFAGYTAAEARSRKMVVAPLRSLTPGQNAILRRGLAFNCDDRIATIEEFLRICGDSTATTGDLRSVPWHDVTLPDETGLRFCGVCGKELPEIARFCPGCGASAEAASPISEEEGLKIPGEYRPATTGRHEKRALGERIAALLATAGPSAAAEKAEPRPLPKRLIAFGAIGVVVALAAALLALYAVRWSRGPHASLTASARMPARATVPASTMLPASPTLPGSPMLPANASAAAQAMVPKATVPKPTVAKATVARTTVPAGALPPPAAASLPLPTRKPPITKTSMTTSAPDSTATDSPAVPSGPGDVSHVPRGATGASTAGSAAPGKAAASSGAATPSSATPSSHSAPASGSAVPDARAEADAVIAPPPSGAAPDRAGGTAHDEDIDNPPIGKHVAAFKLADDSPTIDQACPYPAAAEEKGDTGTVILLVYVASDGSPGKTAVESSSDSKILDDAAVDCVEQHLHFVPKRVGGAAVGSWARMTFKWSFGE